MVDLALKIILENKGSLNEDEIKSLLVKHFREDEQNEEIVSFTDIPKKWIAALNKNMGLGLPQDLYKEKSTMSREEKFIRTLHDIETFLNDANLTLRKNIYSQILEIKYNTHDSWKPLDNDDISTLYMRVKKAGLQVNKQDFVDLLKSKDFTYQYNPVSELFTQQKWDGNDWIGDLTNTITLKYSQDKNWWEKIFKKWLVGIVSCLQGETINDIALILTGSQGVGKTTFLEAIFKNTTHLHTMFKTTNTILTGNKDSEFLITQFGLIILDELDTITSNQLNSLKSNFSKSVVSNRPAYGYILENRKRIASFCGSSNNERLLSDNTGNRRFLVFPVKKIDSVFKSKINYDQVLLQADHIRKEWLRKGKTHFLTKREIQYNDRRSLRFMAESLEEQSITETLLEASKIDKDDEDTLFESTEKIALKCWRNLHISGIPSVKKYGRVLTQKGYTKGSRRLNGVLKRGFFVKYKESLLNSESTLIGNISKN